MGEQKSDRDLNIRAKNKSAEKSGRKCNANCMPAGLSALFTEFKGALTEQYVLQQLVTIPDLGIYYDTNDRGSCEIDFVQVSRFFGNSRQSPGAKNTK